MLLLSLGFLTPIFLVIAGFIGVGPTFPLSFIDAYLCIISRKSLTPLPLILHLSFQVFCLCAILPLICESPGCTADYVYLHCTYITPRLVAIHSITAMPDGVELPPCLDYFIEVNVYAFHLTTTTPLTGINTIA